MVVDRINEFINEKGIKKSKISEITNIPACKISLSLKKKRTLKPDELALILISLRKIVPETDILAFLEIKNEI